MKKQFLALILCVYSEFIFSSEAGYLSCKVPLPVVTLGINPPKPVRQVSLVPLQFNSETRSATHAESKKRRRDLWLQDDASAYQIRRWKFFFNPYQTPNRPLRYPDVAVGSVLLAQAAGSIMLEMQSNRITRYFRLALVPYALCEQPKVIPTGTSGQSFKLK